MSRREYAFILNKDVIPASVDKMMVGPLSWIIKMIYGLMEDSVIIARLF